MRLPIPVKDGFLRITTLSTAVTGCKLLGGVVTTKVAAIIGGPEGLAILGQIGNLINVAQGVSGGIFAPGLVREIAKKTKYSEDSCPTLKVALLMGILVSTFVATIIAVGAPSLADELLESREYAWIFLTAAAVLPGYTLGVLLSAYLNGIGDIANLAYIQIIQAFIAVLGTILLSQFFGFEGVVISTITLGALIPIIATVAWPNLISKLKASKVILEWNLIRSFTAAGLMSLVGAICAPVVQIVVRNMIIEAGGLDLAGSWQALQKISATVTGFAAGPASIYLLPRLTAADNEGTRRTIISFQFKLLPLLLTGIILLCLFSRVAVETLFSKEFSHVSVYIPFLLAGDFFRCASWAVGYVLWARGLVKWFIGIELTNSVLYIVFSSICLNTSGEDFLKASMVAHLMAGFGATAISFLCLEKILKSSYK
jgi:PST family polysaccharide transporter